MLFNFRYKKSNLWQESFLVFEKGKPPPGPTGKSKPKEGSEKTPPKPKPPTRKLSAETGDSLTKLPPKKTPPKKVEAKPEVKNKPSSFWDKLLNLHKEIGDALTKPPAKKTTTKPPEKPAETTPKIPKSYLEALKAKATPEEQEELEKLRQKAEKEVPLEELKGHKWLGISDKDNTEKPLAKYHKLGQMYLEADEKGETLTVREEFNRSEKVKGGLKPATILPPTFRTIEITSDTGEPVGKGIRAKDPKTGEVGYYAMTSDGKPDFKQNLSIKGSYKIKPLTFIDEDSDEFRNALTEEQREVAERLKATDEYEQATTTTPKDVERYVGKQNYPVSSLRSLRTRSNADIRREVTADEAERIARAKIDLTKIEGSLTHHGIKLDPNSEITGGRYLVSFDGKGCETLGWNSECDVMQKDWLTKLNDKEFIDKNLKNGKITLEHGSIKTTLDAKLIDNKYVFSENGEEIKNPEQWATKEAAKLSQKTKTAELILAMQNGGKFNNHVFAKGYEFNITHLAVLNNLVNNPDQTAKLTEKLGKPIKGSELIKSYLGQGGKTMTLEEAKAFAKANNITSLVDGNNTINHLYNKSDNTPTTSVKYDWDIHAPYLNHPENGGVKSCAFMVSDILGLKTTATGREGMVSDLVSRLMKGNEKQHDGNSGVVFGFENFQKGDVIVWQRYNQELGKKTFAHIGIIRDTINIDGQKFIAIQHDSDTIQVDLVPVQSGARTDNLAAEIEHDRHGLASRQTREDRDKLESIFAYRAHPNEETVRIRSNAGWFGDGSKGGGNIMLAVRTKGLSNENPLVADSTPAVTASPTIPEATPSRPAAAPSTPRTPSPAPTHAESDETPTDSAFQQKIEEVVDNMKGNIAVSIYDPDTGQYLAKMNENKSIPAASLIKVPILLALHKAVKLDKVPEREVSTLMSHAEKMIVDSNNYSTDVIINFLRKQFGMEWINKTIQELGLTDTKLERLLNSTGEWEKEGDQNWTTAEDMRKVMTLSLTQTPPAGWASAMDLMQLNALKAKDESLAKTLPQDVTIAQKGGQLPGHEHYAATFTIGNKKLVMVVMVSDYGTRGKAKEGIRKIGRLVYNELKQKTLNTPLANS